MNEKIQEMLFERILILDGPMGTMIQNENLKEKDYKGEQFESFDTLLKGNNDILNLTKEKLIYDIHTKYLLAGADIIETNTFNSTKTSQLDYKCEDFSYDLNFTGGKIARKAVDDYLKKIQTIISMLQECLGLLTELVQCPQTLTILDLEIFHSMSFSKIMKNQQKLLFREVLTRLWLKRSLIP